MNFWEKRVYCLLSCVIYYIECHETDDVSQVTLKGRGRLQWDSCGYTVSLIQTMHNEYVFIILRLKKITDAKKGYKCLAYKVWVKNGECSSSRSWRRWVDRADMVMVLMMHNNNHQAVMYWLGSILGRIMVNKEIWYCSQQAIKEYCIEQSRALVLWVHRLNQDHYLLLLMRSVCGVGVR